MFGYVRPLKGEMKVRDYERFKACYCGLCHTLGKRCGFAARFVLNYDFAFLAALLGAIEGGESYETRRCPANPLKKRKVLRAGQAMELCADESVILAWWKLRDDRADERFPASLKARLGLLLLRPAYKKAAARQPDFDAQTAQKLKELAGLEGGGCTQLDRFADCFASILAHSAGAVGDGRSRRAVRQLLYHIGRWVYITDARDDLAKDLGRGHFNALAARYGLSSPELPPETELSLEETAMASVGQAEAALALIDFRDDSAIIENTVHLGLPYVWRQVAAGNFQCTKPFARRSER